MKKAKKRLAVVLVLVVAVNMLLQGGINTLAQAKPLEGSKDNSVKSEKSMSDKGKAPEKKQDNRKEKKNVKPSDPKKEEKGRINKDKKDQNDKNKNDKKDNKERFSVQYRSSGHLKAKTRILAQKACRRIRRVLQTKGTNRKPHCGE